MICPTCHGTRWARDGEAARAAEPCPECQGQGLTSCCEGASGGPGQVTNGGGSGAGLKRKGKR
jgi:hypothetical protein